MPRAGETAPICPIVSSTNLSFVTLAGGGLFVVDHTRTPMQNVAEYDMATIHPNGCGGLEASGAMLINSGAGSEVGNPSEFDVYRFPLRGYSPANAPNLPAPQVLFTDDFSMPHRDSHGMVATKQDRYVWTMDRARNVAEVLDGRSGAHVGTVDLVGGATDDPTPDLADISPSGNRIFVSLRGPNPLSGSPHVATGSTPGLGVIQVTQNGRTGFLKSVVPISNIVDGIERADAHGIRVRERNR